jgi:hypothetical protein
MKKKVIDVQKAKLYQIGGGSNFDSDSDSENFWFVDSGSDSDSDGVGVKIGFRSSPLVSSVQPRCFFSFLNSSTPVITHNLAITFTTLEEAYQTTLRVYYISKYNSSKEK